MSMEKAIIEALATGPKMPTEVAAKVELSPFAARSWLETLADEGRVIRKVGVGQSATYALPAGGDDSSGSKAA